MKTLLIILFISFGYAIAQNSIPAQNFDAIRTELTEWDPIRGDWLASSFIAMSNDEPIPERTFPERLTPSQLFSFVPDVHRNRVVELLDSLPQTETQNASRIVTAGLSSILQFARFSRTRNRPTTWVSGEPHVVTFDNVYYRNSSVGEYILAKNETTNFEVQARFERISEAASFITATSMNVGGDRIAIYGTEKPDGIDYTSLRVNGEAVVMSNSFFFLPNGGTITYSNKAYTINWPSGECAIVQLKKYESAKYQNVAIQVNDDESLKGITTNVEKSAADIVRKEASLFEYNQTKDFDYYSEQNNSQRANKHVLLTAEQKALAKKVCVNAAISEAAMEGCVYDYAHYGIAPNPMPFFENINSDLVLEPLNAPVRNNNGTIAQVESSNQADNVTQKEPGKRSNANAEVKEVFREIMRAAPRIILEAVINSGGSGGSRSFLR